MKELAKDSGIYVLDKPTNDPSIKVDGKFDGDAWTLNDVGEFIRNLPEDEFNTFNMLFEYNNRDSVTQNWVNAFKLLKKLGYINREDRIVFTQYVPELSESRVNLRDDIAFIRSNDDPVFEASNSLMMDDRDGGNDEYIANTTDDKSDDDARKYNNTVYETLKDLRSW